MKNDIAAEALRYIYNKFIVNKKNKICQVVFMYTESFKAASH